MRSISIVFCVLVVLLSVNMVQATIIHVPAEQTTIQGGINASVNGDTVLVAPLRYAENINFLGKAITVMSEKGPEVTVIDGGNAGRVVTFSSGEDSHSVIRGFTLIHGYAEYGGGIYCYGSSPTIVNNFLVLNACAPHRGGPALYCGYGSNARIYGNLICLSDGAAAIFLHVECNARVVNNTVCDNNWGGLSIQGNSHAYVKNNIFYKNAPYGIHASVGGTAFITCNDVFGQENNYAGDLEDRTGINGNISCDPMFCNVGPSYPYHRNYYLADTSCCVGAVCGFLANRAGTIGAFGIGCPNPNMPYPMEGFNADGTVDVRDLVFSVIDLHPSSTGPAPSAVGDANADGAVDVGDVVYLINYLFKNGPAPTPLPTGDANCNGNFDVGDVVYLINYLFKSGPPPTC